MSNRTCLALVLLTACGGDLSSSDSGAADHGSSSRSALTHARGALRSPGDHLPPAPPSVDIGVPDVDYAEGRLLVGLDGSASPTLTLVDPAGRLVSCALIRTLSGGRAALYAVPAGVSVPEALDQLQATGQHRYVEPDYLMYGQGAVDPGRSKQWHLDEMSAESAWALATGDGVTVAVIDSGVSEDSTDGITNLLPGATCLTGTTTGCSSTTSTADDNGHGSHVAAVIGQKTNNGAGASGLAYNAKILPIRAMKEDGTGSVVGAASDLTDAVNYAVKAGARIVNMSFGSTSYSATLAEAIRAGGSDPRLFVASTGNDYGLSTTGDPMWPAALPEVLAVGATQKGGTVASYSNRGCGTDLVAPGGEGSALSAELYQKVPDALDSDYAYGTSESAAIVSATAALMWSAAPTASASQIRAALLGTASDKGTAGMDTTYGYGLVQPVSAIKAITGKSSYSTREVLCLVSVGAGRVSCDDGATSTHVSTVSTSSGLVLRLNMDGYVSVRVNGRLASASSWALELGDSSTNDGYCGDSGTTMYDAEAWILGSGYYVCDADMGGSDYEVNLPSAVTTTSDTVTLEACDGELNFISSTTGDQLDSTTAFQFGGDEKDSKGVVNDKYLYLGLNRVIRTTSRSGAGADSLTLTFQR